MNETTNTVTCANGCSHTMPGQICDQARIDARIVRELLTR